VKTTYKMSILLAGTLLVLSLSSVSQAVVLFQDNFDSDANWTATQPLPPETQCYQPSNCGMPGGWTAYKNGSNRCGSGVSGRPGNNLWYINAGAGYGDAYSSPTSSCYSGSKCATYWMESCVDGFEDSDGSLAVDLGQTYQDIYVRWYVKFKPNFELMSGDWQFKMYHFQHSIYGSNPFTYFDGAGANVPVNVGGLSSYSDGQLYFFAETRCYGTYYCHSPINWALGTISSQRSNGLLDGNWHSIEVRTKMNSSTGTSDGLVELWIDGVKKSVVPGYPNNDIRFNQTGVRGVRTILIGGNSDVQWDLSSSTMQSREQWYAVDDVVVATQYIGPGDPQAQAPAAPTGLRVQ